MEQISEVPEYKTGFELLEIIVKDTPWISSKILENAKDQGGEDLLKNKFLNARAMIEGTFVWSETTQGHEFWNETSHLLRFVK